MKKTLAFTLSIIVLLINLTGCNKNKNITKSQNPNDYITLVTGVAGVKDRALNQLALISLERAKQFGFDIEYLESYEKDDYLKNIEHFTGTGADVIIGVGTDMSNAVRTASEWYPNENFVMLDYTFPQTYPNVLCIEFEDQQVAYLLGYIGSYMSEPDNLGIYRLGFLGSEISGIMDAFEFGFRAGAAYGAKEQGKIITVEDEYLGSFYANEEDAEKMASEMYDNGIDIIFVVAGGASKGALRSAIEKDKYIMSAGMDKNDLAPKHVLSCTLKRIDNVIEDIAKEIKKVNQVKEMMGKSKLLGLKEGGVDISESTKDMISAELMAKVQDLKQKIINKEIDPPYDEETYTEYIKQLNTK